MNQHHQRAIAQSSIALVAGGGALLKLGHLYWGVLAVTLLVTAWVYRSTYVRSRNAEKYGMPPSKSVLLRGVDRRNRY